jgi:hypothetical protein
MRVLEAGEQRLVFVREFGTERLRGTFNLSEPSTPFEPSGETILNTGQVDGGSLAPYGAVIEEIS